MESVTVISVPCPSCGKRMWLTGHTPTCQSVIYDFSCIEDGDRVSWHRRMMLPIATFQDSLSDATIAPK
jgi:hypothetical protein